MRQNKKKIPRRTYLLAAFGGAACLAFGAYAYARSAESHAAEPLPPATQSAAVTEEILQLMPEGKPAPGALKIPIFIYHSVRPTGPNDSDTVRSYEITPELFEKQLQYLQTHGYTTISLDEVAKDLKAGTTSPTAKPVVLTFDDGWENQYVYAFPLLKKYHMAATFFVFTNAVGVKHWLTWDQLREMHDAGMNIEAHSLSHPRFSGLPLNKAKIEMTESKQVLEAKLGATVNHFASPFGYSSADLIALAKEAGFETYRTTHKGVYQDNPLRLRGILVTDSFDYFVQELTR